MFEALTVLHILVASMVTGHALLNKSDVRAAIGWIGLAWLSPFIGGAIYLAFGINRVARRASKISRPLPMPDRTRSEPVTDINLDSASIRTIAKVGDRVTGLPLTEGNAIKILQDGDEAYPAMLTEIASAKKTIVLASYIFRPDHVGARFVDALKKAHERGVEIRVLVDGIGSGYFSSPVVRQLQDSGIPARRFMHDWRPWRMPFLNLRNHKKLMIIDGCIAFAGGLNLGVENVWPGHSGRQVADVHFRLQGPVVSQLLSSFAEDWHFTTGEALVGPVWFPKIEPAGQSVARGISSGPDEDVGKIETILAAAIGQAQHRLRIVTPYFLPDERLRHAFGLAALRGITIDIVIPEISDHRIMHWAVRSHLSFFPLDRMRCFQTVGAFDHSKLFTVDGKWCAIGSTNWDVRSLRLNFEFMIECYDPSTIAAIDEVIDAKISNAKRLYSGMLASRTLPVKLRDASSRLLLPYL